MLLKDDKGIPAVWVSWNDKDGYGFWLSKDEADLNSAEDFTPVELTEKHPDTLDTIRLLKILVVGMKMANEAGQMDILSSYLEEALIHASRIAVPSLTHVLTFLQLMVKNKNNTSKVPNILKLCEVYLDAYQFYWSRSEKKD